MFRSERIKALAPPETVYFRLAAHLQDGRTKVYPADPVSYFPVEESSYGVPSSYYAMYFFTEQYGPMPHHKQAIQIDFQSEVHRASQSQLSLHQASACATERPLSGSDTAALPLNTSPAAPPPRTHSASAAPPAESADDSTVSIEDAGLEFRKHTYAMDLEDRQQEFIKNSSYVTA